jgi:hypothetical protein
MAGNQLAIRNVQVLLLTYQDGAAAGKSESNQQPAC